MAHVTQHVRARARSALGTLFRDTQSLTYAEGVYRRVSVTRCFCVVLRARPLTKSHTGWHQLMRLISQGGVDRDHTHEAYDRYA